MATHTHQENVAAYLRLKEYLPVDKWVLFTDGSIIVVGDSCEEVADSLPDDPQKLSYIVQVGHEHVEHKISTPFVVDESYGDNSNKRRRTYLS